MSKDYREPEEFLSDESFLAWYLEPGQRDGGFWNSWMTGRPDRQELVGRAIALLEAARIREMGVSAERVETAEAALLRRIDVLPANGGRNPAHAGEKEAGRSVPLYRNWRWIAAACILLLLVAGMVVTRVLPSHEQLATDYGVIRSQQLPDGSEVTMNANSRLRYFRNWQDGKDREVWIQGEALFHVRKTRLASRFIVHTDRFDVVVKGTQFNVVNRRDKDYVFLREGSVVVHPQQGEDMAMVPGDFVRWAGTRLEKSGVRSDSVLAWQQHQLLFDKTPLREVAGIIEDQYGVKVNLLATGDSTITGILPNNNLDVLLQALETTADFDVSRDSGTITIKASTSR
jgi:transmembrane sensor